MNQQTIRDLAQTVQRNCHISDARHGADYSLCVYLMKMREYFRWEMGLPYGANLAKDQVGNWLQAREQLWEELEGEELRPIPIQGEHFEPFDADAINQRLAPSGLIYSAGLGQKAKPHFFLGKLEQRHRKGGYSVFVVASEYARDLTAPPAMSLGDTIFLRRESLRRMLWEKLESWRWSRPDNALGRAFACYDFENDLEASLDAMTNAEIDNLLLHEIGEHRAGSELGEGWNEMLLDLIRTPAELMGRAVRDHLADCLSTLPTLVEQGEAPALHFYMGNLTHMRKDIFPGLNHAYAEWLESGDGESLQTIARIGAQHWRDLGNRMLELHRRLGTDAADRIQELVRQNYL
jgi:hypothetical protein